MSEVTFRIIEGENYWAKFSTFVEEYNKGTLTKVIIKELNLNDKKYRKYLDSAVEQGLVVARRRNSIKNAKYYYKTRNGSFIVSKRNPYTHRIETFGTYHSLDEAKDKVDELIKCNWGYGSKYEKAEE